MPKTTTTPRTLPSGTRPPSTKPTPTPPGRRMTTRATRTSSSMKKRPRPLTASRISNPEEAESGHVIQLQLAANAAFGRAKGRKGKGKSRGKSK